MPTISELQERARRADEYDYGDDCLTLYAYLAREVFRLTLFDFAAVEAAVGAYLVAADNGGEPPTQKYLKQVIRDAEKLDAEEDASWGRADPVRRRINMKLVLHAASYLGSAEIDELRLRALLLTGGVGETSTLDNPEWIDNLIEELVARKALLEAQEEYPEFDITVTITKVEQVRRSIGG